MNHNNIFIFTDLDGSLLNHNNFEFKGRVFPDIKISNFQSDSGIIGAALLAQHE